MRLPNNLSEKKEWTLVGPMGPKVPEKLLTHPLLAVDGGAEFSSRIDVWVGDRDSCKKNIDCNYQFDFPAKKEMSDFALALKLLTPLSSLTLHLWGFLGGRRDHEMMNLGEICQFMNNKPRSKAIFYDAKNDAAILCLAEGEWTLNHLGIFSIASLTAVSLTLTGHCHYQIIEKTQLTPLSSFGLSNVGEGEFSLITDGPVLLYLLESTK